MRNNRLVAAWPFSAGGWRDWGVAWQRHLRVDYAATATRQQVLLIGLAFA
jgi:hypothetical protein